MPFTLSHAIAVLPFRKLTGKYLSMTALVAGSMAPDFEFFLRATLYGDISHTWVGFFVFDFPVAVGIALIFQWIIKRPLIDHLPHFLKKRLITYKSFDWIIYFKSNIMIVLISALLGVFTHFAWDNLTHEPNYVSPIYFDFLLEPVSFFNHSIPLYHLLQHLSSLLGISVIMFVVWRLPVSRINSTTRRNIYMFWVIVSTLALILIILRYLIGVPDYKPFGQFVVISISASLLSLLLVSSYYKWLNTN